MVEYGLAAGGGRSFGGADFSAWTNAVVGNPVVLTIVIAVSLLFIKLAFFR